MILRKTAAGLGPPGPGQIPLDIRQILDLQRHRPDDQQLALGMPHRQTDEPQIIIHPDLLRSGPQAAAMVRGQGQPGLSPPMLPGGEPLQPELPPEGRHRQGAPAHEPDFGTLALLHRRRAHRLRPEPEHGSKAQQKAEPGQRQHHQQQKPGHPFLVGDVEAHTGNEHRQVNQSSSQHISAAWGRVPFPEWNAAPAGRSSPGPPPGRKGSGGEPPCGRTLPARPRGSRNPGPGAGPRPWPWR